MPVAVPLAIRRSERRLLLDRAVDLLRADERVVAAWLFGSMGRGTHDDLSDIDLRIAVPGEQLEAVARERREFAAAVGRPLLVVEAPQNAPPGGAYLWVMYPGEFGPQYLDLSWQPESNMPVPGDVRVLFSRVGPSTPRAPRRPHTAQPAPQEPTACSQTIFFWAMAPVVAKYLARRAAEPADRVLAIMRDTLGQVRALAGLDLKSTVPFGGGVVAGSMKMLREMSAQMEALMMEVPTLHDCAPPDVIEQVHHAFDLAEAILSETTR